MKWSVIIAVYFQFKQLKRRSLKKIRASTGFEPVTSAIPVRCSTNWAMKSHIGSEVNLLSSYFPVQWSDVKYIWNNSYLYCGCRWSEVWSSQYISNSSNWKEEAWKKSGLQRDSNPWPPRYRCDALPTELWSHTLGAHIAWIGNILRWSHFTSSTSAAQIWIISYILHITSLHGKIWTQQIDLAPNVWLHSSVGRASHRYRGGHGFESRWSPDFFQASSFQLLELEIYCDDHTSLQEIICFISLLCLFTVSSVSGRWRTDSLAKRPVTINKLDRAKDK